MNWVIIVLLLLSIVGSMMWMMPSPRQRVQALLRQKAMRQGIQVQMARVLFPREIGEAVPDEQTCIAYRLPRTLADRREKTATIPWHIFRLNSHATEGLPEGWCWSKGEGYLEERTLQQIAEVIESMPDDCYSIESTPVAVSMYWYEKGTPETVEDIYKVLRGMIESNL